MNNNYNTGGGRRIRYIPKQRGFRTSNYTRGRYNSPRRNHYDNNRRQFSSYNRDDQNNDRYDFFDNEDNQSTGNNFNGKRGYSGHQRRYSDRRGRSRTPYIQRNYNQDNAEAQYDYDGQSESSYKPRNAHREQEQQDFFYGD